MIDEIRPLLHIVFVFEVFPLPAPFFPPFKPKPAISTFN